jgi:DNA helicase II / ATP-dependent DNA helicase PcrA
MESLSLPFETRDPAALLAGLNPRQAEAVQWTEGPALVLAGAGSGKTRVLVTRIAHLVRNLEVDPGQVLGITFTRKAAAEMRERLARMLTPDEAARVTLSTFHALGATILRDYATITGLEAGFSIADESDVGRRIRKVLSALAVPRNSPGESPREVASRISQAKGMVASAAAADGLNRGSVAYDPMGRYRQGDVEFWREISEQLGAPDAERFAAQYAAYQGGLLADNTVDYDDLVCLTLLMLQQRPEVCRMYNQRWHYLMVDEYQDTDANQDHLLRLLAGERRNLMVVGDDSQAIYSWRGARIENIQTFPDRFSPCARITMDENYRSTGVILDVANSVLTTYPDASRFQKTLWTKRAGGGPVRVWGCMSQEVEAEAIANDIEGALASGDLTSYDEALVLYRVNALSRCMEEEFRRRGIPYRIVGHLPLHERRGVKDIIAYLKIATNGKDSASFERAVSSPSRGIGPATVELLASFARTQHLSLVDAASRADEVKGMKKKQVKALAEFAGLVRQVGEVASTHGAAAAVHHVIEETGVRKALAESLAMAENEDDEEAEAECMRRVFEVDDFVLFVEEFCRADLLRRFGTGAEQILQFRGVTPLVHFLDQVATLGSDADEATARSDHRRGEPAGEDGAGRVTLMSVHGSKGLEARRVYVIGLEESVFPLHGRTDEVIDSASSNDRMAEEARLFYVAVTRAMETLTLSASHSREVQRDNPRPMMRSRFVNMIPEMLIVTAAHTGD